MLLWHQKPTYMRFMFAFLLLLLLGYCCRCFCHRRTGRVEFRYKHRKKRHLFPVIREFILAMGCWQGSIEIIAHSIPSLPLSVSHLNRLSMPYVAINFTIHNVRHWCTESRWRNIFERLWFVVIESTWKFIRKIVNLISTTKLISRWVLEYWLENMYRSLNQLSEKKIPSGLKKKKKIHQDIELKHQHWIYRFYFGSSLRCTNPTNILSWRPHSTASHL